MENNFKKVNLDGLKKLISEFETNEEILLSDIPSIDLYMDQVTTLFDDKLSHQKRFPNDVILTKTMINNYAKAKILPPIKNKKYNKQQIILLILIYNLKQILSLEDIKAVFNPLLTGQTDISSCNLVEIYEKFLNAKSIHEKNMLESFDLKLNELNFSDSDDTQSELIMAVLLLITGANFQKRLAEKIIDLYFK